jgi:hypothetical protein
MEQKRDLDPVKIIFGPAFYENHIPPNSGFKQGAAGHQRRTSPMLASMVKNTLVSLIVCMINNT